MQVEIYSLSKVYYTINIKRENDRKFRTADVNCHLFTTNLFPRLFEETPAVKLPFVNRSHFHKQIIIDLFAERLRLGEYERALQVCELSKQHTLWILEWVFGKGVRINNWWMSYYALSKTIKLLAEICDVFVARYHDDGYRNMIPYVNIGTDLHEILAETFHPWFVDTAVYVDYHPLVEMVGAKYRTLHTGPYLSDLCITDTFKTGRGVISKSTITAMPAIVLKIATKHGDFCVCREDLLKCGSWVGFSKLLRICLGPTSGVFFLVDRTYIGRDLVLMPA